MLSLHVPEYTIIIYFLFQLPAAVGEAPTFGFAEEMANKFFKPSGVSSGVMISLCNVLPERYFL